MPRGRGLGRSFAGRASAAGLRCGVGRFWFPALRRWRGVVRVRMTAISARSGAGRYSWCHFQDRHVMVVRSSACSLQFMRHEGRLSMISQQARLGCQRCERTGDTVLAEIVIAVRASTWSHCRRQCVSKAAYRQERQTKKLPVWAFRLEGAVG